ncbi:mRNA export factor Gle1 [Onthophagus taurus]|uniref:mRNA export factor Gle1 n=1 Tax=Onthophagus taurus TaxID=166361 RepID=UPI0039BE1D7C
MDDDIYNKLKNSAFSKMTRVSPKNNRVTLGPEAIATCSTPKKKVQKLAQTPKTKYTISNIAKPSPMSRLIAGLEKLKMEDAYEAINQRHQQLEEFEKEQKNKMKRAWHLQQQYMVAKVQDQEFLIYQALEEHNKNAVKKNEKLLEYYQEIAERRRKKDEELQEKEQQKKELLRIIDVLKRDHTEFREGFQEIVNLTKTQDSVYLKTNLGHISTKLKVLNGKMDEVVGKCKTGNVSQEDVVQSSNNLTELRGLQNKIVNELETEKRFKEEKIKEAKLKEEKLREEKLKEEKLKEMERLKQEQLKEQKLKEAAKKEEIKSNPIQQPGSLKKLDDIVSMNSLKQYSELQDFQVNVQNSYNQLEKDESLKQFKFDCKKAINIPVNAISGLNPQHLLDKYNRLSQLLAGKSVQVGDKHFSASIHPQGILYCMDLLAKKFVLQGDLMISSNPESAFYYGTIIVSLWNQFPDFGKLILAHFHKQCPYLVPIYLPKSIDQTDRDYYESLGYKYNEDGTVEKQDKFLKRMIGIIRLYAAVIISFPKKDQGRKNPLGLTEGWRWLTAFLNLEPRVDVTATLLQAFLETSGFQMQAHYGKQFVKLMKYFQVKFMPMLKKIDTGGPFTRLEGLLREYVKRGQFEKPGGILKEGFW